MLQISRYIYIDIQILYRYYINISIRLRLGNEMDSEQNMLSQLHQRALQLTWLREIDIWCNYWCVGWRTSQTARHDSSQIAFFIAFTTSVSAYSVNSVLSESQKRFGDVSAIFGFGLLSTQVPPVGLVITSIASFSMDITASISLHVRVTAMP